MALRGASNCISFVPRRLAPQKRSGPCPLCDLFEADRRATAVSGHRVGGSSPRGRRLSVHLLGPSAWQDTFALGRPYYSLNKKKSSVTDKGRVYCGYSSLRLHYKLSLEHPMQSFRIIDCQEPGSKETVAVANQASTMVLCFSIKQIGGQPRPVR